MQVRIEQGQKGQQVSEVVEIDPTSSAPSSSAGSLLRSPRRPQPEDGPETEGEGTVKWYSAEKGFGFIGLEGGDKDVFVHGTALTRSGLASLSKGEEVVLTYVAGKKGLEARSVRVRHT